MNTELAIVEEQKELTAFTCDDVKKQVGLIQSIMREVMQEGEHYGVIPGCGKKPSLLKGGAEKLMLTFRLAPSYEELTGTKEEEGFISYKIRCSLEHIPSGKFVGSGLGACNSREKKYARNNPWDIQNTLYKMACKRALVAAVLNCTAASDIFTQDIEDLPKEIVDNEIKTVVAKHTSATPFIQSIPKSAPNPSPMQAAQINEQKIIEDTRNEFFEARDYAASVSGNANIHANYMKNSKGESPELSQIKNWSSPKQIAWLRQTTEKLRRDFPVNDHSTEEINIEELL